MDRTSRTRRHAGDENATTTTTAKSYYSRRTNNVSNVAQKARGPRRALGDVTNRHAAAYGRTGKAASSTATKSDKTHAPKEAIVPAPPSATYEFKIDQMEARNPQACTEYVREMYHNYRKAEGVRAPNPNYMSKQTDISEKMRGILLDWLVEVHLKFKFEMPTLYLTANIIDRFLERKIVLRQKLQLVGVTAMLLASKYEEMFAPEVADFVYLTDRAYTKEEILACESSMLSTLSFRLSVPTVWVFLCRFVKLAGLNDRRSYLLARYYAERTLMEYKMLKYLPSTIAASAVYMALKVTHGTAKWSSEMHRATKYSEATLKPCVNDMVAIINGSSTLQAIRKKYSSHRYQRVAKIPLPEFD